MLYSDINWNAISAIASILMVPLTAIPLWLLLIEKQRARLAGVEDEFKLYIKGIRKSLEKNEESSYYNLAIRDALNRKLSKNRIMLLIFEELTNRHYTAPEATQEIAEIMAAFQINENLRKIRKQD